MSIEKNINSRIVHKHDIEANWIKATNFIPKQGEIIIYDIDDSYSYPRFKIGDGVTLVNDLSFAIVQSDWSQNNQNALNFIQNRTHYIINEEKIETIFTLETDNPSVTETYHSWFHSPAMIEDEFAFANNNYIVISDGQTYAITGKEFDNFSYLGNLSLRSSSAGNTGENFLIIPHWDDYDDGRSFYFECVTSNIDVTEHSIIIKQVIPEEVQKLDPKYYERLGWKEKITNNIIIEQQVPFNQGQFTILQKLVSLNKDLNYTVTIGENTYSAGKPKIISNDDICIVMLGNTGIMFGTMDPNTVNLPFLFVEQTQGTETISTAVAYEDDTFTTPLNGLYPIIIAENGNIVHKISEEYYDKLAWEKDPYVFTIVPNTSITIEDKAIGAACENCLDDMVGNILRIIWDGVPYNFIGTKEIIYNDIEGYYVGNPYYLNKKNLSNNIPFAIWFDPNQYESYLFGEVGSHTYIAEYVFENIQRVPNNLLPLATLEARGAVAPEAKTDVDIQPVTIDENGRLWTEPTSNTVVRDDDNGNVVLISLATQNHENIVTDDGDGNVEVWSTSMYNPFPGIENAEIGQTVEIAEVDSNGFPTKWNTVDAGANSNIFIITMENDPVTGQPMASATPAEIYQQVIKNKIIIMPMEGLSCSLMECSETETSLIALIPNTENLFFGIITIAEDRTITLESDTIDFTQFITTSQYNQDKTLMINELNNKITRPTSAAVGQVLSVKTVNANGVPTAWETSSTPQFTKLIMPDTVTGALYELSISNGKLQISTI